MRFAGGLTDRADLDARAASCPSGSRRCRAVSVASGSVRASSRHQSACRPPLAHTFWPLTTNSSPSRRAVVRSAARSEPASGSEKPCTQISPSRIAGRWRCRCSSVPAASRVDAAWWMPTKASTSRGASAAASSEYSTICSATDMPPPHSAGQCGTANPAACSSANQAFWKRDVLLVARRRSARHASRRAHARRTTAGRGGGTVRGLRSYPVMRRCTVRSGHGCPAVRSAVPVSRTGRAAVGAAAGCTATARTAPSRRRTRPHRAAGG